MKAPTHTTLRWDRSALLLHRVLWGDSIWSAGRGIYLHIYAAVNLRLPSSTSKYRIVAQRLHPMRLVRNICCGVLVAANSYLYQSPSIKPELHSPWIHRPCKNQTGRFDVDVKGTEFLILATKYVNGNPHVKIVGNRASLASSLFLVLLYECQIWCLLPSYFAVARACAVVR